MNNFLAVLDKAFRECTATDFKRIEQLLNGTNSIQNFTGETIWDGLRYKPFYFWKFLAYFASRGSGTYTIKDILQDISVFDSQKNEEFLNIFKLKEFLSWADKKEIFVVRWGEPARHSVESETVSIDTDPIFRQWGFMEVSSDEI